VQFYRDRLGLDYSGTNSGGQEMFAVGGGAALALMSDPDAAPTPILEAALGQDRRARIHRLVRFTSFNLNVAWPTRRSCDAQRCGGGGGPGGAGW
jgi:hypothetical protein